MLRLAKTITGPISPKSVVASGRGLVFAQNMMYKHTITVYDPAGNLVQLNTGEIAVVMTLHAPDPHRPHVRILVDREGRRLELPYEIHLWEPSEDPQRPASVVAPVDPADYPFDPLLLM